MSSMVRHSPFRGVNTLRREIDRLFDEVGRDLTGSDGESARWAPRADIAETDEAYLIRVDVPGISKDDLEIELKEDTLTVSGERRQEREERGKSYHRVERSRGRFYRAFKLPQASPTDDVEARLKNGVLTLAVPKREEARARRIEIS